ncbi:PHD finger domain-containing protein [Azohydromonas lata]|uniref:Uncharacterized protein n=1 Tax=Azohydromonas lata TaxID=45677 RepID=A0ABU5IQQ0_9BURK|nr:hypothetical protein [Azohydromonas lata]MDZ5461208.1 hypothetical protein [Azohydromonas lata]
MIFARQLAKPWLHLHPGMLALSAAGLVADETPNCTWGARHYPGTSGAVINTDMQL